jgi:hypothetical protein
MINQMLKLGALIATGRFLKQRIKGLLGILLVWLVLWFVHSEFVSYVELSGDRRYVLHATVVKLLLYAMSIGVYVWRVERPLWPKTAPVSALAAAPDKAAVARATAVQPAGDDGFDFLRTKKKLRNPSEQLLKKPQD